jgi:hypothetical protein
VTTGCAGEASIVPPHPTRGVPSMTCAYPMAGTGVPLLVHSCMRWSWIRLRLSWAMTSLLMAVFTVKIRQPSHEFTFGVGISFIPYPLVLTPVV